MQIKAAIGTTYERRWGLTLIPIIVPRYHTKDSNQKQLNKNEAMPSQLL